MIYTQTERTQTQPEADWKYIYVRFVYILCVYRDGRSIGARYRYNRCTIYWLHTLYIYTHNTKLYTHYLYIYICRTLCVLIYLAYLCTLVSGHILRLIITLKTNYFVAFRDCSWLLLFALWLLIWLLHFECVVVVDVGTICCLVLFCAVCFDILLKRGCEKIRKKNQITQTYI